ncbi:Uncharacterized membrane protein [Granulicatella balaenopterae]|uniref:Uncharacterized membrane protein n=1 Tax=Granulicatella balaenopterae TaxID=137733 RepID=A0A1H9LAH2_9LACT|nr:DMT family transporter [Granulicatella balaenopterae]SER08501.1 Uncharacterized membrane protein [Granulicatella balaenopterae]
MNNLSTDGSSAHSQMLADQKMAKIQKVFSIKGIGHGLLSGFTYGIYSTLVAIAASYQPLSTAVGLFAAPFVCSGLNDLLSGIWLFMYNFKLGKLKELPRTLKTKSGMMMVLGFLLGGPIANGAYLIGLAKAGVYAIPISATNAIWGSIFAWIFFKQVPSKRVICGMLTCVVGASVIGWTPVENADNFLLGIFCALIAAIGWGMEGMFSSFGGTMLDSDVIVNLRQLISGGISLIILVPFVHATGLLSATLQAGTPVFWLALSGLAAGVSFVMWYKANSQIGCAMGMSLNISYAFWGVLLGILFLHQAITMNIIVGSLLIICGAILVTMNPLEMFKKGDEQ